MRVLATAAVAIAASAAAVPATAKRGSAYRVSITATLYRQVVDDIATKPGAGGCRFVQSADAVQTLSIRSASPFVRTLAQLGSATPVAIPLAVRETRLGSFRKGNEHCAAGDPVSADDTTTCGTLTYTVTPQLRVGFLGPRDNRFAVRFSTSARDPFGGGCLARAFDDVVAVPPARWAGRRAWTRTHVVPGKPLVVRWTDTLHVEPLEAKTAAGYDRFTSFEHDTVTWEARLTPVP